MPAIVVKGWNLATGQSPAIGWLVKRCAPKEIRSRMASHIYATGVAVDLDYEPRSDVRYVVVEHLPQCIRVRVPMVGYYAPKAIGGLMAMFRLDAYVILFSVFLTFYRWLFRVPRPDRAVFDINATHILITERCPDTASITRRKWLRKNILELRPNRYESGLWVHRVGRSKDTYFADLPRDAIDELAKAIHSAMAAPARVA